MWDSALLKLAAVSDVRQSQRRKKKNPTGKKIPLNLLLYLEIPFL